MIQLKIVVLIFSFFILSVTSTAQTKDSIFQNIKKLEEITLSATRFPEKIKHIPQEVLIFSENKIASLNQPTTAEILQHTGNVSIQKSQGGGGSPVMRGFEANKILIVVDGVRMNNAIFRGGHLQNVITIDPESIERLEILYGPSSLMYGSDALGGVLHFYSKKPLFSLEQKTAVHANFLTRLSTAYDEKTQHAAISIGTKKFASLTSLTFSDFGNIRQGKTGNQFPGWGSRNFTVEHINGKDSMVPNGHPHLQTGSEYHQYGILQKFLFRAKKMEQQINFQFTSTSNINRYDRLSEINNTGQAKSAEWYYGPQQRLLLSWNGNFENQICGKGNVTAAYQFVEESRNNRNFGSLKLNHRIEQVKIGSVNADFKKLIKNIELGYGLEFIYNDVRSRAYGENIQTNIQSDIDTRYPDGGSHTQNYAAYTSAIYKFNSKLILHGGVRFTYNNLQSALRNKLFFPLPYSAIQQSSSVITTGAGIVYTPNDKWKISALFSTGFRTPNVDDLAKIFESGNGNFIIPNPDLKPERTLNYETGISAQPLKNIFLQATGWFTSYTNVLTTDFSTYQGSPTILYDGVLSNVITTVNKKKAYIYGFSVRTNVTFLKHFQFQSCYNYTFGRIYEQHNYPLDHIPPTFGRTGLYMNKEKFTLSIFVLYNGSKDSADYNLRGEDNHQYSADKIHGFTPFWITYNFQTSYKLDTQITIHFSLENITDRFYRTFSSGISAAGRNAVFALKFRL